MMSCHSTSTVRPTTTATGDNSSQFHTTTQIFTGIGDMEREISIPELERSAGPVGVAGSVLDAQFHLGRSLSTIEGFASSRATSTVHVGHHHLGQSQSLSPLGTRASSSVSNSGKTRSDRLKQAAAKTAAVFYGECYLEGVGVDTADEAARESHESYRKFWLQQFGNHRLMSSFGDAHNVPLFNAANGQLSQHSAPRNTTDRHDSQLSSHESDEVKDTNGMKRAKHSGYFPTLNDNSPACQPNHLDISTSVLVSDYGTDDDHQPISTIDDPGKLTNNNHNMNSPIQPNQYSRNIMSSNDGEISSTSQAFTGMTNIDADILYSATNTQLPPQIRTAQHIENAKTSLLHSLAVSDGDVTNPQFLFALNQLRTLYNMTGWDARDMYGRNLRSSSKHIEGTWMTLSRPNYYECLGKNSSGEYMYTLGRMSFDMFRPTNLVCSIQGVFNTVEPVNISDIESLTHVPRTLKDDLQRGDSALRSYNIVTAFNIEADSPQFGPYSPNHVVYRSVRGIMTTYGFVLPDPIAPNRLSIWFNRGTMEPNDNEIDTQEWKRLFGGALPKRQLQEKARLLAAKLLLGAIVPDTIAADGSMSYFLSRPVGGHGTAYVDILYLDDSLRIVQGSKGSIFVFARVPAKNDL